MESQSDTNQHSTQHQDGTDYREHVVRRKLSRQDNFEMPQRYPSEEVG